MDVDQAKRMVERGQQDPGWWIKTALGANLWADQIKIIEAVRDNFETVAASCHGAGKTFLAACTTLWFLFCFKPSIVLTTAPTDRQVRKLMWKEIGALHARALRPLGGKCITQELQLERDWFAAGFTAPDWDETRFQGFHEVNILAIVDEAAGVTRPISEGIDGVLSSEHARKLSIGNPTDPTSQFADDFKRADVSKHHISVYDTPNFTEFGIQEEHLRNGEWRGMVSGPLPNPKLVTPEWAARMGAKWGWSSPVTEAKIRGQFPDQGTDTLIPMAWIVAAQNRVLPKGHPVQVACDVARFGDDDTSIGSRWGGHARIVESYNGHDTMETTGRCVRHRRDLGAECIKIDGVGVGAGSADRLAELGEPVIEINAGERAIDPEQFPNVACEMAWNLRERFDPSIGGDIDIDPDDDALAAQLANRKYKTDSSGRIQIERKEELKKRGLPSPDRADTLGMLFYERPRCTRSVALAPVKIPAYNP